MLDLTPEGRGRLDGIAARHGVSGDAALALLRALAAGGGRMAQFSHPELGGMGQWSRSGMVMVGDMFDAGLKRRVGALCAELAALLEEGAPFAAAAPGQLQRQGRTDADWWPAELGAPASSGAQDGVRYAYFPASRRLAVERGGRSSLHDTGSLRISGFSQHRGDGGSLVFSTDRGAVRLQDLPVVDASAGARPEAAPPASEAPAADAPAGAEARRTAPGSGPAGGDPLSLIERLADLHARGILTAEEFAAKKAELLGRL